MMTNDEIIKIAMNQCAKDMMFSLLDLALTLYQDSTTFDDIEVEQYERFTS